MLRCDTWRWEGGTGRKGGKERLTEGGGKTRHTHRHTHTDTHTHTHDTHTRHTHTYTHDTHTHDTHTHDTFAWAFFPPPPPLRFGQMQSLLKSSKQSADYGVLSSLYNEVESTVRHCNEAMRIEEDFIGLQRLEENFEFSRFKAGKGAFVSIVQRNKRVVRRGQLKLLKFRDDAGIAKAKEVTCILTDDWFIYAKPPVLWTNKQKLSPYRQLSRESIQVSEIPDLSSQKKEATLLFAVLVRGEGGQQGDRLVFHCESEVDRERWLTALCNRQPQVAGDDIYEQPSARKHVTAMADYVANSADEMSLRPGMVLVVIEEQEGWVRGFNAKQPQDPYLNPALWFPSSYVCAVDQSDPVEGDGWV